MTKTITIHDVLSIKWINQKAKQLNVNLEDLIVKNNKFMKEVVK